MLFYLSFFHLVERGGVVKYNVSLRFLSDVILFKVPSVHQQLHDYIYFKLLNFKQHADLSVGAINIWTETTSFSNFVLYITTMHLK